MRTSTRAGRLSFLPALLLAAALPGCGGGGGEDAAAEPAALPPPAAATIVIENYTFIPEALTVAAGEQITVVNRDAVPHTVTAWDGAFESGLLSEGSTYQFSVEEPGEYPYRCDVHEAMTARLIVTPTPTG